MIRVFSSTDKDFESNGDIVLKPLKAKVSKADNGDYFLTLETSLEYVDYILQGNIVVANTPTGDQAFRIGNVIRTKSKLSTKAYHVFYDAQNYLISDSYVVEKNCAEALAHLNSATEPQSEFETFSDINTIESYRCVRTSLYGAIMTVLERWKGHLVRDNFRIGIVQSIGQDNGVVVQYRKNLKEITCEEDWSDVITKILPVGKDGIMLNGVDPTADVYITSETQYTIPYTKTVSFQQDINEEDYPSEAEYKQALVDDLRRQANVYLSANCIPKVNYTLKANLDKITDIGDTVEVIDEKLGIDLMAKVISFEYDCISEKYTQVEFGNFTKSLSNLISTIIGQTEQAISVQGRLGSIVSYTQMLLSGSKIAEITIDGAVTEIFAPESGDTVGWSQIQSSGEKIAEISINGETQDVYAPEGGSGDEVGWNQIQSSGTKIAEITINGESQDVYAPTGGGGGGDYVSRAGDTMTGTLAISAVNVLGSSGWNEGLRINAGAGGYTTFVLGGQQDSVSGIDDGAFWIGTNRTNSSMVRHLYIAHNGSTDSETYFYADSASRHSPCLYLGWSGEIAHGDARAVHGHQVYYYLASGNANRDLHDCNIALKNGVYYYNSNGPDPSSLGMTTTDGALYVQSYDSNAWVAQIAQDYRTGNLCVRGKNNGTWQPWKRIIDSGNIGSQSVNYANSANYANGAGTANSAVSARDHFYIYNGYSLLLYSAGNGGYSQLFSSSNLTLNLVSGANWLNLRSANIQCRNGADTGWSPCLASAFNVQSSKRYKENIEDIPEAEAVKLLDVRIVKYDYKEGVVEEDVHRYNQHGVIAEEVAEILPEVVNYAIPYGQEDEFSEPVPDGVDYSKFVPYLIKMVQMQQKEIDELKNQIKELKK